MYLFKHLFYRVYCWNINVIKEKDLPILSAYLFVSVLIGINIITLYSIIIIFVIKDSRLYPEWGYYIVMLVTFIPNYFYFIHRKKYKSILMESEIINKSKKRKWDILVIIYLLLSFIVGIYVINESRDLLVQLGLILK